MSILLDLGLREHEARYSNVAARKLSGSTYTPRELAAFVAEQMLQVATLHPHCTLRVLDPAVGDGALLEALIEHLPISLRERIEVWGFDTNPAAIQIARSRIENDYPEISLYLEERDFLEYVLNITPLIPLERPFHLVIANPPYVRTQILGTHQAQTLAKDFGLTGRVDLYYPFLLGISRVLAEGGVAGVITSNRFMTTRSGQSIRQALLSNFDIAHLWDLGDTKLFEAAVLPSILIASRPVHNKKSKAISFSTIYETKDPYLEQATDVLEALSFKDGSVVKINDGRHFRVRHGILNNGGIEDGIWRIGTGTTDTWLATVEANTWAPFRRIGKIRVGVKSTADKVFIRSDWSTQSNGRPELLRPLITRHCARRYKADTPSKTKNIKEILYPHTVVNGKRTTADLSKYPKTKAYLEQHRKVLEARTYVIDAGRKWYELWVPQDPDAWSAPKLVFPDISEKPIFWIDTNGGIVNGECYWLSSENQENQDLLWIALAVANSTFIEEFYDHKFNNKLYAGRRRFITQYVEQFPLPNPALPQTKEILRLVKEIYALTPASNTDSLSESLDILVWSSFGLNKKISG